MSTPANQTNTSSTQYTPTPPGQDPMGAKSIAFVAIYLIVISILVLYGLLKLWPHPTPSGEPSDNAQVAATTSPAAPASVAGAAPATSATNGGTRLPDPERIYFIGGRFQANVYAETRLLLIVMLAGALGSLMHSLRSLTWYTGNREMVWSWVAFYMLLPFMGAILATIFYFVVRGGFFSPQASFENTSPFGFAALSSLVGLFSSPAALKLKEIAETIFTKPAAGADAKTQESLPATDVSQPPLVNTISPSSGSTAGAETVTIAGAGFASNPTVLIGNLPATVVSATATSIEATTPASASGAGTVDVEVSNPDGRKATLSQGFTYVADVAGNNNGEENG